MNFNEFKIHSTIVDSLAKLNFIVPSQIQAATLPQTLQGFDTICQASAGTGKTLCFLTTILQYGFSKVFPEASNKLAKIKANQDDAIIQDLQHFYPYVLIIIPTRELAIQIMDILNRLINAFEFQDELLKEIFQPHLFIGGLPIEHDRDILKLKRCSIVIGTLGRLMQLVQEKYLALHNIQIVVLDEADKMFENKQFQPNFKRIMSLILGRSEDNKPPQIMCFSATYPQKYLQLITSIMRNPKTVMLQKDDDYSKIQQYYLLLKKQEDQSNYQLKVNAIVAFLRQLNFKQTIVFYNDKNRGENLFNDLRAEGFKPIFIHGDQNQSDRIKVMHQVRRNKANLIVSTDLLSRGIDVDTLDLVIHFDIPNQQETYFHRIGRTGRYGSFGVSLLLFLEEEDKQKEFEWVQNEWKTELIEETNSQIKLKYEHEKYHQQTDFQHFGKFLDGVSDWKDKNYKFYDESKFKYKETDEEIIIQRELEDRLQKKKKIKKQNYSNQNVGEQIQVEGPEILFQRNNIVQTQQKYRIPYSELQEIMACECCQEFMAQLEIFSGKDLKIKTLF